MSTPLDDADAPDHGVVDADAPDHAVVDAPDPFVTHRGLLFTVAYEMLGSAADAEDVLQESWLRWAGVDRAEVRDARAYLVRIVTRQALNHLRTVSRRREEYVGEWLPEPLLTSPDVADDVELADSVSIAMLTVLETLAPTERAVFVLREVFDVPYDEIAVAVDKSPASVRQIAHRARDHVARRPRVKVERSEHERVVARLADAVNTGDVQALMDVLAPDVVSIADGGGQVRGAARRPIVGAKKLAAYLMGGMAKYGVSMRMSAMPVNGQPGLRVEVDGQMVGAVSLTVEEGRVTRIFTTANPQKLARLDAEIPLTR
ncbi:RNA polymerase sigma-70 factor [Microbacterium yannicii]|uniref:RNA polymerase sigma-70 factor n=1 Tax=Microbacterium yannicii TaxID=671622 RepID=UPI000306B263|nr:RNA polymerase sigma-70 factor [Microbacterium yannicii]